MMEGQSPLALARKHLRDSWKVTAVVCAAALACLMTAAVAALALGTNLSIFTRDPLAIAEAPFYLGFLSSLGVMIWTAGGALALFGGHGRHAGTRKGRFLVAAGWFSLVLAADDMFMLHDIAHEPLGIDFSYVFGAIGLFGVWRYRTVILGQTNFLLFALAFGGLGMSAGMDGLTHSFGLDHLPGTSFIEDAFKFMGICLWTTFAWQEAARALIALPYSTVVRTGVTTPVETVRPAAPARKTPAPL
ncbi:hypothetical protein ACM64Y_08305 [Novispirillum sp. DQ9]|uniref:hypothetical protein n=1 Tax=Novispirillum sp. DQ9 TaxID=3398612 RepID=UPI003C7AF194